MKAPFFLALAMAALVAPRAAARGLAEHAVGIVWDGTRADDVTPQFTIRLYKPI